MKRLIVILVVASFIGACKEGLRKTDAPAIVRVSQEKIIRCGYAVWPKFIDQSADGKSLSGFFYDLTEEIAARAGISVDWSIETSIADIAAGLNAGKFDLYCGGLWPTSERATMLSMSRPASYSVVSAFVRGDFKEDNLNDSSLKIATIEGEASEKFHRLYFPKTTPFGLPKSSDGPSLLLAVSSGKADFAVSDRTVYERFEAAYPGKLRIANGSSKLALWGNVYASRVEDVSLVNFINIAIDEIENDGSLKRLRDKYNSSVEVFLPVKEGF